jgi:Asp-tRNA(Asn)/Glu-tRNA(Gln) amidotransferase A subunit family amidase
VGAALQRLESVDPSIEAFVSEPTRRSRLESTPPGDGPLQGVGRGGEGTAFWYYAGFRSITLPVFDGLDGMPLGIQLVAPPERDEHLLPGAELLEVMLAHDRPALPT